MSVIAGRSLGTIGANKARDGRDKVKDRPADPARLAALVAIANAAGLGRLGLDMPKLKCGPCDGCDHQTICRARGELGLWAPCEQPFESDLLTLSNVLEDQMSNYEPLTLGERLKALREKQGLNRSQLARRIGAGHPAVKSYEENNTLPTMATLAALAWALDTAPEAVFDGVNITPEIARKYAVVFEQEYSGIFTFTVTVSVAGDNRAEIVKAAKRALRQAGVEFAGVPRVEALPEKLEVTLDGEAA